MALAGVSKFLVTGARVGPETKVTSGSHLKCSVYPSDPTLGSGSGRGSSGDKRI